MDTPSGAGADRARGRVWLTLSVVGRYLRAWGFTAQRPAWRATERRDEAVRAWLERTYPAIARKAKVQGCEIQWADETGLSNQANYGRSFAAQGQTPVIPWRSAFPAR